VREAAHALNNLLTLVHAAVERLGCTARPDGAADEVRAARAALQRASARLDDLVALAGSSLGIALPEIGAALPEIRSATRDGRPTARAPREGAAVVLVVDDDAEVCEVTRAALARSGHHVITAANAGAALHLLRDPAFLVDVLVTDLEMPDLWGTGLARSAAACRPGLRVLVVSGHRHAGLNPCPGSGTAFLPKPYAPEALVRAVGRLLDPA
jgi:CheY-like chemotaxis protein